MYYSHSSNKAIADTRASKSYLQPSAPHSNEQKLSHPIQIGLPNGGTLHSNTEFTLHLPLPSAAIKAYIVPGLTHNSLLSIGVLCDADCIVTLMKNKVYIHKDNQLLMKRHRALITKLWILPLNNSNEQFIPTSMIPQTHQINNVMPNTKQQLVLYCHQLLFSSSKTTLIAAMKDNYFKGWPGLNVHDVQKYLHEMVATHQGHLDQTKPNIMSTSPPTDNVLLHSEWAYATIESSAKLHKIYTGQMGRLPFASSLGMNYIMI